MGTVVDGSHCQELAKDTLCCPQAKDNDLYPKTDERKAPGHLHLSSFAE